MHCPGVGSSFSCLLPCIRSPQHSRGFCPAEDASQRPRVQGVGGPGVRTFSKSFKEMDHFQLLLDPCSGPCRGTPRSALCRGEGNWSGRLQDLLSVVSGQGGAEATWGLSISQRDWAPQEVWPLLPSRAQGCTEPLSQREGKAPAWSAAFTAPSLAQLLCKPGPSPTPALPVLTSTTQPTGIGGHLPAPLGLSPEKGEKGEKGRNQLKRKQMLAGAVSLLWGQRWKPAVMRELLCEEALLPRWSHRP